ncbi:MAG: rhamnulokinase family protein [Planctomycetia bacterium]|nr:rhamnulokinase family protein [Planctomycetia bacterium]
MKKSYLAIDMGASSGRHVVGHFDGKHLELEELYRYENGPIEMQNSYFWNLPGLWSHVQKGLTAVGSKYGSSLCSIGVDTWGVDFAFLGRNNELLGNPYCYRDPRTDGAMEKAFAIFPRDQIFANTGLQFMQFNSLYQLLVMKEQNSPILEMAERFLMIPDLFHWLLSGIPCNEFTNSTTTQCFDPQKNDWAFSMLEKFGIPTSIFKKTSVPGTILGPLQSSLAQQSGILSANVVLPGTHDTASAVMAVPTASPVGSTDWAYISLGTWALMGIESTQPFVNETVSAFNFTNEGGVGGTIRILKNICGLWLLQECRRIWNQQGLKTISGQPLDWEDLNQWTAAATPLVSFIDPDAREFLSPTDMPQAIRQFAAQTDQTVPQSEGAILRTALDSIALKFRQVLEMCEKISGQKIKTIHIVGGGTKNCLLCQAAANATGCRVITGPIEATAIGNIMMQAVASGDIGNITEARQVIRNSFDVIEYEPQHIAEWNEAYEKFCSILKK